MEYVNYRITAGIDSYSQKRAEYILSDIASHPGQVIYIHSYADDNRLKYIRDGLAKRAGKEPRQP